MDQRLRELERRFQESGDPADEGRLLAARVQGGVLARERVVAAAALGHPGAVLVAPEHSPPRDPDPWRSLRLWARRAGPLVGVEGLQRAVVAEGERLLSVLDGWAPPETARNLIAIEGPRSGMRFQGHELTIGADGVASGAPVAVVRGAQHELEVFQAGALVLNGAAIAAGRHPLAHGDMLHFGEDWVLIYDVEDDPAGRARVRRAIRIYLDWAAARIAGAPDERPQLDQVPAMLEHRASEWACSATAWLLEALRPTPQGPATWPAWPWPATLQEAMRDRLLGEEAAREWPETIKKTIRAALVPWLLEREDPLRARGRTALDRLELSYACPFAWNDLEGSGRVRHCEHCKHDVFDISAMSRADAQAMIEAHTGKRLCVRMYRRADGRVATGDCQDGLVEQEPGYGETLGIVALDEDAM